MSRRKRADHPETLSRRLGSPSEIRRARRAVKSERTRPKKPRRTTAKIQTASRSPRGRRSEENEVPGPWRIRLVLTVFFAASVILVARAAQLQVVDGEAYEAVAERQATSTSRIKAKRGVIRDRHDSDLAITVDVDSVFAEPRRVVDARAAAAKIAPILGQPARELEKKLSTRRRFTYLQRRVDGAAAQKIRDLGIVGVSTHPEPKRFYANVGLASHVLGFTNLDGEGKAGVELVLDEHLRGQSYDLPGMRDALGKTVFSEGFRPHSELAGADVTLTIDRQIQYAAESALARAAEKFKAKAAVAIVLEPKSGDVLGLASWPTYNPNNLNGTTTRERINRAVSAIYEPGSTLKMVTIAAALEEGLVGEDSVIDCEGGSWRVGGRTIRDSNHKYGQLTITEILKLSSNICSAKIGFLLGRERLHDWLFSFGMGEKTGVELPGELRGLIRPADEWRDIALANIAFGQGIAVTPLQIVQAAATIANDGVLVPPRIVKSVALKSGEKVDYGPGEPRRVINESTAKIVRRMMVEVTKDGGTAEKAAVPGFEVAGKTGTAQKIDPVTKAYSHELYIASFVGLVPADRPEVAILVLVDEPKGSIYGGTVAAPAFAEIAAAALAAREVFPEGEQDRAAFLASFTAPPAATVPTAADLRASNEKWLESEGIDDVPTDEGGLDVALSERAQALLGVEAAPRAPAKAPEGARTPNFVGLGLLEVLNRSADVRCDPVVNGTGRVVRQKPARGAPLPSGSACEVWLAPPDERPRGRSGA